MEGRGREEGGREGGRREEGRGKREMDDEGRGRRGGSEEEGKGKRRTEGREGQAQKRGIHGAVSSKVWLGDGAERSGGRGSWEVAEGSGVGGRASRKEDISRRGEGGGGGGEGENGCLEGKKAGYEEEGRRAQEVSHLLGVPSTAFE